MSKEIRIKTEIKDINCLKRAIEETGFTAEENKKFTGYFLTSTISDLLIPNKELQKKGIRITGDIGFKLKKDGSFDILTDDMNLAERDYITTINKITQKYSRNYIQQEVQRKGWRIQSQKTLPDNTIHIRISVG